jgi:guanylate cyclase
VDLAAEMALGMLDEARACTVGGFDIRLRIGIDTGPAIAGVIGRRKFAYDVWGDTVNTASRMEGSGEAGRIQVTERVEQALRERYELEARGPVEIKGKGSLMTWYLIGRRDEPGG